MSSAALRRVLPRAGLDQPWTQLDDGVPESVRAAFDVEPSALSELGFGRAGVRLAVDATISRPPPGPPLVSRWQLDSSADGSRHAQPASQRICETISRGRVFTWVSIDNVRSRREQSAHAFTARADRQICDKHESAMQHAAAGSMPDPPPLYPTPHPTPCSSNPAQFEPRAPSA